MCPAFCGNKSLQSQRNLEKRPDISCKYQEYHVNSIMDMETFHIIINHYQPSFTIIKPPIIFHLWKWPPWILWEKCSTRGDELRGDWELLWTSPGFELVETCWSSCCFPLEKDYRFLDQKSKGCFSRKKNLRDVGLILQGKKPSWLHTTAALLVMCFSSLCCPLITTT